MATVAAKLRLAQSALTLTKWQWFAGAGIGRNRDERTIIPHLLLGLYLAHKAGKKLTKGEVCRCMHVDQSRTSPKYIRYLVQLGLVEIEARPAEDRRKDFVLPTARLLKIVEAELPRALGLMLAIIPRKKSRH